MSPRPRSGSLVKATQDAIERRVRSSHESMALQQSRFLARTITWALVGTAAAGVAWLALAKTDEVVVAPGKLQPIGDVSTVQMPVGGVLDQMLVKEGERVSKGQVLLRLDNEATLDRRKSTQEAIQAKQEQLQLKQLELQRYLNLNDTEQQVLRRNSSRRSCSAWSSSSSQGRLRSSSTCSSATSCARWRASWRRCRWTASGSRRSWSRPMPS